MEAVGIDEIGLRHLAVGTLRVGEGPRAPARVRPDDPVSRVVAEVDPAKPAGADAPEIAVRAAIEPEAPALPITIPDERALLGAHHSGPARRKRVATSVHEIELPARVSPP